jgi:hypothetical protein
MAETPLCQLGHMLANQTSCLAHNLTRDRALAGKCKTSSSSLMLEGIKCKREKVVVLIEFILHLEDSRLPLLFLSQRDKEVGSL